MKRHLMALGLVMGLGVDFGLRGLAQTDATPVPQVDPASPKVEESNSLEKRSTQIKGIQVKQAEEGLVLQLSFEGVTPESISNLEGNTLIFRLDRTTLDLGETPDYPKENLTPNIKRIDIQQASENSVEIRIEGIFSAPKATLSPTGSQGIEILVSPSEPNLMAQGLDVIVTAEKTPELSQNVPISMTILTRQELEDGQIFSLQDVAGNTPNFSFFPTTSAGSDFSYYSIRGISNFNFLASRDSVGFYLDDIPFDFGGFLDLGLFDLERIEILRGPQNTLYGRSSPAGVVNIISQAPTNTSQLKAAVLYGNYNQRQGQLSYSNALIPNQLAFRISGIYQAQDGLFRNETLDKTVGQQEELLGRLQLLWTPIENLSLSFNSFWGDVNNGDPTFSRLDGSDVFTTFKAVDGFVKLDTNTQALRIAYDGADFRAISVTARRFSRQQVLAGDNFIPGVDSARSIIDFDSTLWSQEIRFQSPTSSDRFRWLVGGYYESRSFNVGSDGFEFTPTGAALFGVSPGLNLVTAEQFSTTLAGFTQLNYKPVEPLTLFAGLRYESTDLTLDRRRVFIANGVVTPLGPPLNDASISTSELLPRLGLQYRFSPNVMAYTTIAKGYRPPGLNYRADSDVGRQFGAETVWTYEVGMKTNWLSDLLIANLAFFYNDINGYQVLLTDQFGFFRDVINANVKGIGGEFEFSARPIDGLELTAGVGYVDSRFQNYQNPFTLTDFTNNQVPYAPNLTYNIAIQYRKGIFTRLEVQGYGVTFFDDANLVKQDPFALVNLRLGYEWKNVGLLFFVNNLFDTRYITSGFLFPPPIVSGGVGAPTTFGAQVRMTF